MVSPIRIRRSILAGSLLLLAAAAARAGETVENLRDDIDRLLRQGNRAAALDMARSAYQAVPRDPYVRHCYGWALLEAGRAADALPEFARASEIAPDNARYAYVHGIALNAAGRTDEALAVLEASQARHPADRDTLLALATINRDAGRFTAALRWADRRAIGGRSRPAATRWTASRRRGAATRSPPSPKT